MRNDRVEQKAVVSYAGKDYAIPLWRGEGEIQVLTLHCLLQPPLDMQCLCSDYSGMWPTSW